MNDCPGMLNNLHLWCTVANRTLFNQNRCCSLKVSYLDCSRRFYSQSVRESITRQEFFGVLRPFDISLQIMVTILPYNNLLNRNAKETYHIDHCGSMPLGKIVGYCTNLRHAITLSHLEQRSLSTHIPEIHMSMETPLGFS